MELEKIWSEWKVDKYIGEGSFGKVYKIIREEFGHTYEAALKVIEIPQNQSEYKTIKSEGLSDDSVQEYFKSVVEDIVNEFALMSKLKGNSNIVSYEDHSVVTKEKEFGWEIFIRMELLTPLFNYLEENELTVRNVIQLGIDMCKALEVCQKYNIIHRDIKPENIFVSDIGTFKLGDFGIARQLEKTTSGMSKKGTYTYMAPEVYKGLEYNSTVDIYSLGIVLYRFLNNNRTPFMPPAPQQIRYSDKEQANVLRLSGQKMPKPCNAERRLAEIVLKACAYNPKERYESPYAMRQELQTLLYTESEKRLVYPEGDVLTNYKNEYSVGDKTEFMDELENIDFDLSADTVDSHTNNSKNISEVIDNDIDEDKTVMMSENEDDLNEKTVFMENDEKGKEEETDCAQQNVKKENTAEKNQNSIKPKKAGKRIFMIAFGVAILAIIAVGVIALNMHRNVLIPDIGDMNIAEAKKVLQEKGLEIETTYATSKKVEKNVVISQSEKAGTEVKEGSIIHVIVCGATVVAVPKVVEKNTEEALKIIENSGLDITQTEEYSNTVSAGVVISQIPGEGEEVKKGTKIAIVVSKGANLVEIPDVTGKKQSDAKKTLESIGMKVSVEEAYSNSIKKGKVISQNVSASKKVKKGTHIKIKISKGKKIEPKPKVQSNNNNANTYVEPQTKAKPKSSESKKKNKEKDSLDDWELIN